jgi:CelD/BcsL family acetyltransferase involved in cellulose biosynthesis
MDPTRAKHILQTTRTDNSPRLDAAKAKHRMSVVVVRDLPALYAFVPAWEELAAAALEPNVFYEHWMLLPALEAFGAGKDISVVLVLIRDPHNPDAPAKLGGLFPLELIRSFRKLNVSALGLWQHVHCYMCTPLVRADTASECMAELFRWFRSGRASASLIELRCISGDGPFHKMLVNLTNELGLTSWATDIFTRGLWHEGYDEDTNPESAVSGNLRRRLRRKEKRLSERGRVEHLVLRPDDDVGRWIDEFLRIEASGWKGHRGSALASSESDRRYFTEIATSAFRRGRLLMLGINFNGRPIARRCAFVAGEGSFAFKTAYDEEFADFSPGAMLEMDSIRQLHALPEVRWMDSCAAPDNSLVNRLSNDRRTIQSLAVGSGALGELVLSGLPLLRWTNRRFLKRSSSDAPADSSAKTQDLDTTGNSRN